MITPKDADAIAPNISPRMMAWRPILADPPLYGIADVKHLTLCEIHDANEAIDLRAVLQARAQKRLSTSK